MARHMFTSLLSLSHVKLTAFIYGSIFSLEVKGVLRGTEIIDEDGPIHHVSPPPTSFFFFWWCRIGSRI